MHDRIAMERVDNGLRIFTREVYDQRALSRQNITYTIPGRLVRKICRNIADRLFLYECYIVDDEKDVAAQKGIEYVIPIKRKGLFKRKTFGVIAKPHISLLDARGVQLTEEELHGIRKSLPPDMPFAAEDYTVLIPPECILFGTDDVAGLAQLLMRFELTGDVDFEKAIERLSSIMVKIFDLVEMQVESKDPKLLAAALFDTEKYLAPDLAPEAEENVFKAALDAIKRHEETGKEQNSGQMQKLSWEDLVGTSNVWRQEELFEEKSNIEGEGLDKTLMVTAKENNPQKKTPSATQITGRRLKIHLKPKDKEKL